MAGPALAHRARTQRTRGLAHKGKRDAPGTPNIYDPSQQRCGRAEPLPYHFRSDYLVE